MRSKAVNGLQAVSVTERANNGRALSSFNPPCLRILNVLRNNGIMKERLSPIKGSLFALASNRNGLTHQL